MDRKKIILLVGALVIAIGTALMARSMFAGAAAPEANAQPQGPRVLVAQRSLPVGTIITADALNFQLWPAEMVQDAYFVDGEADVSKLIGTVVRNPVTAGQPVTQGALVKPGDRGFLAAALGPGMRAITIEVQDETTSVRDFVFPGDRVDVVVTHGVSSAYGNLSASETFARNLRVLATDKESKKVEENGQTVVQGFTFITLEVTPKIAEKIAVANEMGDVSVALRSIADTAGELDRAIASGEIVIPDGATPEEEERIIRAAMTSPQDGETTFVTSRDISPAQKQYSLATRQAAAPAPAPQRRAPVITGTVSREDIGPTVRVRRGDKTSVETAGK